MRKILKIAVSLLLIAAALYVLDWPTLKAAVQELDPYLFAGVSVFLGLEYFFLGYRWHLLINDVAPLGYRRHLRRYLLAVFFSSFTPAQVGGDVYRFFSSRKDGVAGGHVIGLLIRERLIGLASFFIFYVLCFGALAVTGGAEGLDSLFAVIALLCALGLIALGFGSVIVANLARLEFVKTRSALQQSMQVLLVAFSTERRSRFFILVTLTMPALLIWTAIIYWLAASTGTPVPFLVAGMVAVVVDLIRLVPITVQGVGVREASFAFLFGLIGHSPEAGFVVGATAYLAVSLSLCLAGLLGAVMPNTEGEGLDRAPTPGRQT